MALRNIVKIGDPILNKKSRTVEKFDERLFTLLDDMAQTLRAEQGVGLAAVQVGVLKRVVVIDIDDTLLELINPQVISTSGERECKEGCLSLPGKWMVTKRPEKVQIKAQDRTGKWHVYNAEDLKAQAFCHEIDHLDGILFTKHAIRDVE